MGWGSAEFSGQTSFDSHFLTQNVVYFASSGDSPGTSWPATSANVVAVGGVSISRSMSTLSFLHLASWSEAGSGVSSIVPRPSYQASIATIVGTIRAVPDIAADANPETGAWVYDSGNGGWYIVGGTSLASPTVAGITNASNSFASSTNAELTKIYGNKASNPSAFGCTPELLEAAVSSAIRSRCRILTVGEALVEIGVQNGNPKGQTRWYVPA